MSVPETEPVTGRLLPVRKAVERFGISATTINKKFASGELTRIKLFGRTLVSEDEIEGLIRINEKDEARSQRMAEFWAERRAQ